VREAKKAAEAVAKAVKEFALKFLDIFKKIAESIRKVIETIKNFLNSDLFHKILHFFDCVKSFKAAGSAIVQNIKNFLKSMKKLAQGWKGAIEVLINAICQWRSFKQAIDYLLTSIKIGDQLKKMNFFGQFFGQLIVAIGESNR